jgi:CBS domain-containing protein
MAKVVKVKSKKPIPFGFKMSDDIISVDATASVEDAARMLRRHNIGVVIVRQNKRAVGILSERDIAQRVVAAGKIPAETRVSDVMTKKIVTVDLDEGLREIHKMMRKIKFRHLPIRKGDRLIGMISNRDLMYLLGLKIAR